MMARTLERQREKQEQLPKITKRESMLKMPNIKPSPSTVRLRQKNQEILRKYGHLIKKD